MRGIERGLDHAFRILGQKEGVATAYLEIEAFIIENLVKQMEKGLLAPTPIFTDVKTFNPKPFRGQIHGIVGGYPCQPFSCAGKGLGESDPRHLYPYISKIIRTTGPVFCFFENVSNHLNMGYDSVYKDLRSLGYAVETGIFTAEEIGAPHERERLFILAIRMDYARGLRLQPQHTIPTGGGCAIYASEEQLANSEITGEWRLSNDQQGHKREPSFENTDTDRRSQGSRVGLADAVGEGSEGRITEEQARGPEFNDSGELAHANGGGLIEFRNNGFQAEQGYDRTGYTGTDRWPAKRGQEQYSWEPPRLESRLGFVFNGYSYREDLLRMAGNAVMWQMSSLAYLTILNKFKKQP